MSVVVKTLALLALLASGADSNEDSSVVCADRPKIYAKTASQVTQESFDYPKNIWPPYGEVITVLCTGRSSRILTFKNNSTLQASKLNSTTIQLFLQPDIGQYEYRCIDTTNQCQDILIVEISPAISVTAKRFRVMDLHRRTYFVPKGEKFELFCSAGGGTQIKFLSEAYDYADYEKGIVTVPDYVQVETVNKTTIKHSRIANYTEWQEYRCVAGGIRGSYMLSPWMVVKHYPEAQNFRCTARRNEKFECSWNSSSTSHTFKLFYKDERDNAILICAQSSGELSRACTSDVDIMHGVLVLETCGDFCDNQTFPFKSDAIVKLNPLELRIESKDFDDVIIYSGICWAADYWEYKAEYRLLGGRWLPAKITDVTVYPNNSYLNVHLPCPDTYYEVRLFVRNKQATADWLWSEPASISVFTDPKDVDNLDPVCYPEKNLKQIFKYMLALHNVSV